MLENDTSMVPRYSIELRRTESPIRTLETKVGGQPVWSEQPRWPVSRATGEPMLFIAQVVMDERIFGPIAGRVAYLFITDDTTGKLRTWDPASGESAIILQPGQTTTPCVPRQEGPCLRAMERKWLFGKEEETAVEFQVATKYGADMDEVDPEELYAWDDEEQMEYFGSLEGDKVGGSPALFDLEGHPGIGEWRLLLQLALGGGIPLSLGDCSVLFAFVKRDGSDACLIWQST